MSILADFREADTTILRRIPLTAGVASGIIEKSPIIFHKNVTNGRKSPSIGVKGLQNEDCVERSDQKVEDREIIDLFFSRSEDAIDECQKRYGRYCRSVAIGVLSDGQDADECVNDLWLRVWNAIPPHRPENLKTFCGKIVRNIAIDRYRESRAEIRGGGQIPLALDELADCIPDGQGDPADGSGLTDALDRFLSSLPAERRKIFMARYWHMYSIEKIAAALDKSQSSVKMTLLRARRELKTFLEKEGFTL